MGRQTQTHTDLPDNGNFKKPGVCVLATEWHMPGLTNTLSHIRTVYCKSFELEKFHSMQR